jgi:prepilin-type N-terminal cleavage/methylation domain-containing protein
MKNQSHRPETRQAGGRLNQPSSFLQVPSGGFTLIELLVVIAMIGLLAGILLPVFGAAKTKAKVAVARMDMRGLQFAIASYKSAYGTLPSPRLVYECAGQNTACRDFTYGTTWPDGSLVKPGLPVIASYGSPGYRTCNAELIALLKPSAAAATAELRALSVAGNPQQHDFLQVKSAAGPGGSGLGPDGVLRDPWGNPYIITLDLNLDDRSLDGFYASLRKNSTPRQSADIKGDALIWSFGPDGKVSLKPSVGATGGENKDNVVSW